MADEIDLCADHPPQHPFRVANHIIQVEPRRATHLFSAEGQQLRRQLRGLLAGIQHVLSIIPSWVFWDRGQSAEVR